MDVVDDSSHCDAELTPDNEDGMSLVRDVTGHVINPTSAAASRCSYRRWRHLHVTEDRRSRRRTCHHYLLVTGDYTGPHRSLRVGCLRILHCVRQGFRATELLDDSCWHQGSLEPNSTTRTPAMDTTNGQAHNNSTTNLPRRNARAQHLDVSRCWDVANFCPLVVFVGGVRTWCS